jgi:hypothetical protein
MPASEAQKRANLKWRENHHEKYREVQNKNHKNWIANNYDVWVVNHRLHAKKCNYRRYWWAKISQEFLNILL